MESIKFSFFSAAEERAEDDFIRRKIFRRKKVFPTQPSNFEEVAQSGYVRRKVIKPVQIAPPTISTTTELPKVINDENALNRSQDDPRCKTFQKGFLGCFNFQLI